MKKKIRNVKQFKHERRHKRVRNRVVGTPERPRVAVFRSSKHIYAQLVDDTTGRTLATVSTLKLSAGAGKPEEKTEEAKGKKKGRGKKAPPAGAKVLAAREVGRLLAEVAKEKGITRIAFDRGGYLYHGRVAALAEAARENGLEF
jgi:large subunit ribosomal protein L18